jgi:hypothetical protein
MPLGGYPPEAPPGSIFKGQVPQAYREAGGNVGGVINALDTLIHSPIIDEDQAKQLVGMAFTPARYASQVIGNKDVEQAIEARSAEQLSGLTTPESLGQFALFKYPVVRAAFAAQSLSQVPGNIQDIAKAYASGDKQALGEAIADASTNAAMGLSLAAEPLGITARMGAGAAEKAFRQGDLTVPQLLQARQYYQSAEPSGFAVSPDITAAIARQTELQGGLAAQTTAALDRLQAARQAALPLAQREPTGPLAETAVEQAMRRTGTPLRTAAEIAQRPATPVIPGITTEPSPAAQQAMTFFSPNEGDLNFDQAISELHGQNQTRAAIIADDIDRQLGLAGPTHHGVASTVQWGSENSLMHVINNAQDFDQLRYSAALKGQALNQKSVLAFQVADGGSDALHTLTVPSTDLNKIDQVFTDAGVENKTLLPHADGTRIVVYDPGNTLGDNVAKAAQKYGVQDFHTFEGRGEFVGEADTREQARANFNKIVSDYQARGPAAQRYEAAPGQGLYNYGAARQPEVSPAPRRPGEFSLADIRVGEGAEEPGPLTQRAGQLRPSGVAGAVPLFGARGGRSYPELRIRTEFRSGEPSTTPRDMAVQTILTSTPEAKNYAKKIANAVAYYLPRELRVRNGRRLPDAQIIENAIEFFKRNKQAHYQMLQEQPWAQRAIKQYEGYNIHGHRLVDQYGFPIERVLGSESAVSPQTPPDMSFSVAERLMRVIRESGNTRWDKRFDQTLNTGSASGGRINGISPQSLAFLRGKTYDELNNFRLNPKVASRLKPAEATELQAKAVAALKAQWARVYDQTFHSQAFRHITPEGTLGDFARNKDGSFTPITWRSFKQIGKGIRALEGVELSKLLDTAKVSSYYNSKIAPHLFTPDYVVDTHDIGSSWMSPVSSSIQVLDRYGRPVLDENGKIKTISHPLVQQAFGGPESGLLGHHGVSALHAEAGRRAAAELGLSPSQFQAGIWSHQQGFMSASALPKQAIADIRKVWENAANGKLTEDQARATAISIARDAIGKAADPAWTRELTGSSSRPAAGARDAGYPGELSERGGTRGAAGPGAGGGIAPGTAEALPPTADTLAERRQQLRSEKPPAGAVGATGLSGRGPPTQEDFESAANDPEKMRGHIATVQRMLEVSPDVKARVESWYTPTAEDAVNRQANATIDNLGLGKATDAFMRSRTTDADTLALGHNLAVRLDAQGHYEDAAMVRDSMAARLTTPAQSLWYISTIGKTSPEGLIRTAQALMTDLAGPEKTAVLGEINRLRTELAALPEGPGKDAATRLLIRQLAQVNKPGQRLSRGQLDTLLEKQAQGQLSEGELAKTLARMYKIPQLTPDNIAKIKAAQAAWAAVPPENSLLKLKRAADMMDSVYGLVPRTVWDKIRAASVISMILHGKLPIRIGVSNAIRMAGQTLVDTIQNVPADLGNVFSGRKTVTGAQLRGIVEGMGAPYRAYRVGYEDAKLRGLATMPSFREGVRSMIDLAQLTTRGLYEASDISRASHTFSSRFGRLFEDAVTVAHNIVPYAFWDAGFRSSLARQMRLARMDTPTAEMIANAHIDANKAIFYNDTALYRSLLAVRQTLDLPTAKITKGKYGLGTALLPFAKVPAALTTEGLTWTPFGFTKAGWEILRPFVTKEPFRAKEVGDAIVKAALGTGGTMLAGYQLAKIGVLTGAPDENKDLEAMRKASGWGGFKINVSELKRRAMSGNWWQRSATPADGDTIVNYNWLEPIAFPLAMGADIAHSQDKREIDLKRGRITSNAVMSAIGAGFQSLTGSPMLQGIEQLGRAIGEKDIGKAVIGLFANIPGNFVPSLVRQTSQYMDNTIKETRGGTLVDQEAANILAQIPGLAQRYPARYDVFGDAMQRYNYGNNSLINVFFNPAMISKFKSNPQLAEMQRIYEATGSTRAQERQVPRTLMINGQQVQLTNDQTAAYQRYVGKESSAVITRLMASPQYAAEPLPMKQAVIAQVLGAVNNAAKVDLFGQSPVSVGIGAKGPTLQTPSAMELAAILGARQGGLNQPVRTIPGLVPVPKQPLWRLAPPPALPSLAP